MSAVKYKVGDKVVVKSLDWYNANKDTQGNVNVPCCFIREMSKYCGKVVTIRSVYDSHYVIEETCSYSWSDEMFDGLAEETHAYLQTKDVKDLPKDFAECAKIIGVATEEVLVGIYKDVRNEAFAKLCICRDAYWKVASLWEPDWRKNTKKHCIVERNGKVGVATTISKPHDFVFPTPEMADTFGKNFKKELDMCKEILK